MVTPGLLSGTSSTARALWVLALLGAGQDMSMPRFTSSACGTSVDVTVRNPFAVVLEENPTTGYRWDMQIDPGLEVISSDYAPDAGTGVGGGGLRRFLLVATVTGELRLRAKLWRQWLGDASVTRRCEMTVRASSATHT